MQGEVDFPRGGEGSGVTALGVVGITPVAGALVETSTITGVNSLIEVVDQHGALAMVISEGEVDVQADQNTMLLVLHETFPADFFFFF